MTIKKLTAMPYAQAHIEITDEGEILLFSYVTLVAAIDADGWFECYGLYSATTRKHISAFAKEYTPFDYATAKMMYNDNMKINIHTGEVVDRD